jgi:seryl-tRNA synthetase
MLDPKAVLNDRDQAAHKWSLRGLDGAAIVAELAQIDEERRQHIYAHDDAKQAQTQLSEVMRRKDASPDEKAAAREQLREISDQVKECASKMKASDEALRERLMVLPNWTHDDIPEGGNEESNREIRTWGTPREFDFEPRDHIELGESLGILDFEAAARISGARFAVYRGHGARLERSLASLMLDMHTEQHGCTELLTPYLVTRETMEGTGQLPKFEDDAFKTAEGDLFLIPTSEVPVTNLHRGQIIDVDELPIRYTAYSSCFRREAGSYGRDVKGLTRLHQFQKVEMVTIAASQNSYEELDRMVANAEAVLHALEIPYRIMELCTGDIGFAAARTYDLEVWLPGRNNWREISSCSNCETFQARRASIRYRAARGEKPQYVHTLNGSGVAIGRAVIAVLENGQQADGSVVLPKALRPYMGGLEKLVIQ